MFACFITSIEVAVQVPPVSTSAPVSTGDSEDVVMQLKTELDSLKKEVETIKLFLTKEVIILKSEYKRDIEILRQDLDKECTKFADLQIEVENSIIKDCSDNVYMLFICIAMMTYMQLGNLWILLANTYNYIIVLLAVQKPSMLACKF